MKGLFFYKLYKFDKRLFVFIIIFCVLTILCNILRVETTPFFIWAMYSEKEPTLNQYHFFRVRVNDSATINYSSAFTDNNRLFLTAPLIYYDKTSRNDFNDPALDFIKNKLGERYNYLEPLAEKLHPGKTDAGKFASWYARYLSQSTGKPVNKLQVDAIIGHFNNSDQMIADSSYALIRWTAQ